jgi:hypothetical protein
LGILTIAAFWACGSSDATPPPSLEDSTCDTILTGTPPVRSCDGEPTSSLPAFTNGKTYDGGGKCYPAIDLVDKTGVTLRNFKTSEGISITRGGDNRIEGSEFTSIDLKYTSDNVVEGNRILFSGTQYSFIGVGDLDDQAVDGGRRNTFRRNWIVGDGIKPNRTIRLVGTDENVFEENRVRLTNVGRYPIDPKEGTVVFILYDSHSNEFLRNCVFARYDPADTNAESWYLALFTIRDGSSFNVIEGNDFESNGEKGIGQQSSGGSPHPHGNVIRGNRLRDVKYTVVLQSILEGSQDTVIEGSLILSTEGPAVEASGVHIGARVTFTNNTVVALDGAALVGGGDAISGGETYGMLEAKNNIFYASGRPVSLYNLNFEGAYNDLFSTTGAEPFEALWYDAGDGPGIEGTVVRDHELNVDPEFRDVEAFDFRLQSGSACIDAGDPASPVPEGGGDRVDLGAFES